VVEAGAAAVAEVEAVEVVAAAAEARTAVAVVEVHTAAEGPALTAGTNLVVRRKRPAC